MGVKISSQIFICQKKLLERIFFDRLAQIIMLHFRKQPLFLIALIKQNSSVERWSSFSAEPLTVVGSKFENWLQKFWNILND